MAPLTLQKCLDLIWFIQTASKLQVLVSGLNGKKPPSNFLLGGLNSWMVWPSPLPVKKFKMVENPLWWTFMVLSPTFTQEISSCTCNLTLFLGIKVCILILKPLWYNFQPWSCNRCRFKRETRVVSMTQRPNSSLYSGRAHRLQD